MTKLNFAEYFLLLLFAVIVLSIGVLTGMVYHPHVNNSIDSFLQSFINFLYRLKTLG